LILDRIGCIDICVSKGRPYAVATTEQDYNVCLVAEPIFDANFKFLVEIDGELLLVQFVGGAGRFSFF
jgi:hypothetical protein